MPKQGLKEKLISKGLEVVKEKGIENISLRKIAEDCGVTHSSPYRHFKNKEDYLEVLVERISDIFGEYISYNLEKDLSPEELLLTMGINFVNFSKKYPYYFNVLFLSNYAVPTKVKKDTLTADKFLLGFESFKNVVNLVSQKNNLNLNEDIEIVQLWSFIMGFSLIVGKQDVINTNELWIKRVISQMIDIYILGNKERQQK